MESIIEGRNPILEAIKAGREIKRIMLAKDIDQHGSMEEILHLIRKKKIPVEWVERRVVEKKSSSGAHQGIIAYTPPKEYCEVADLLELVESKKEKALFVILDGIEDPQNLGAIIRNVDASGAHGVIIPKRRAAPLTETVSKTSAGAVEHVMVALVSNIADTIERLKKKGVWVIGVEAGQDKMIYDVDFSLPTAIVIGGEGKGMSKLVKDRCEILASIPMFGKVSSLNASAASAIALFEVVRQRRTI
jgi:23S rRNA (guanosine2251-2'-O)-methyltransferase